MTSTLLHDVLRPHGIDNLNHKLAQASLLTPRAALEDSEDEIVGVVCSCVIGVNHAHLQLSAISSWYAFPFPSRLATSITDSGGQQTPCPKTSLAGKSE